MADTREKLIEMSEQLRYCANVSDCANCKRWDKVYENQCVDNLLLMAADLIDSVANGVTVQKWIPVTERLPEERDSIFAKFYGTERWTDGMFLKISKDVLTCVEYEDGTKAVKVLHTNDGKWHLGFKQVKVTHWMPLPEPPKGE